MAEGFVPLEDGELQLENPSELYVRQCHPKFLKGEQPSSQFLADFPRDEGKLSGTRSHVVTATEAYLDYVGQERASAGAWGVTVGESVDAGSRVVDDSGLPQTEPPRPRGHAYLDFRHLSREERKGVVSHLLILFKERGQLAALGDFE